MVSIRVSARKKNTESAMGDFPGTSKVVHQSYFAQMWSLVYVWISRNHRMTGENIIEIDTLKIQWRWTLSWAGYVAWKRLPYSIMTISVRNAHAPLYNYSDVIMSAMASQITGASIFNSTICSTADQIKHQSSASLAFVRGIHRWPMNSPHKGPGTRKLFPLMMSSGIGMTDRMCVFREAF